MPKALEGEKTQRVTLSLRVTPDVKQRIEQDARRFGRSLAVEAETRLERALEDDLIRGIVDQFSFSVRKTISKIVRTAERMPHEMRGTPLEHELNTRREIRAAIDVLSHVYAATEDRRPLDPQKAGWGQKGAWGSGDAGRLHAYYRLEFEEADTTPLDRAQTAAIDAFWTGSGETLGDLDLPAEEVLWRRTQNLDAGEPAPLPEGMRWATADELAEHKPVDDAEPADVEPAPAKARRPRRKS